MPFRDVVGTSITGVHAWDDDAAVLAPDIAPARQPLLPCPHEFPDDFLGYHDILNFVRICKAAFTDIQSLFAGEAATAHWFNYQFLHD